MIMNVFNIKKNGHLSNLNLTINGYITHLFNNNENLFIITDENNFFQYEIKSKVLTEIIDWSQNSNQDDSNLERFIIQIKFGLSII